MKIQSYYKQSQYIHYSNCHEDTEFVLQQIQNNPQKILCIASALDNALAMLLLNPDEVVAIDSNDTQVYLCRLKKCAIEHLEHEDFLILLGIWQGDSEACYRRLRQKLDPASRTYFDENIDLIRQYKLVNCGRFEYYFSVFQNKILPLVHNKKTIDRFMHAENLTQQREIYKKEFNNWKFRLMFKLFFSQAVMKRLGRDKAYFKHNKGSLSTLLLEKFERCVDNNLNAENPYLHYILYHRFAKLPFYLEKGNFEIIKRNIHKITIRKVEFSEILKENQQYDLMYLSDIFEYMDERVMTQMTADITRCLTPGGNVLLFNMMNHRRLGAPLQESRVDQTHNQTFYYMDCYLYRK